MLTNVATTSADAYHAIRRDGSLSRQQALVMRVIKVGRDYSLREIARLTELDTSTVSGRVNELRAAGKLELASTRPCALSRKTIHPVRLPSGPAQRGLFA